MQNFITLAAEVTQEPPSNQSLIILITGFVVVFLMLLLLIGLIKVYSGIVYSIQNKAASKANAKESTKQAEPTAAVPVPVVTAAANEGPDLQTIAVITAAVEAFYGDSKKIRIASIRPTASARSEWGVAGLRENMPAMRTGGLL